jgi:hypothetical protein
MEGHRAASARCVGRLRGKCDTVSHFHIYSREAFSSIYTEMALGSLGKTECHHAKRFAMKNLASMRVWAQVGQFIHLYIYIKKTNYIYVSIQKYVHTLAQHIYMGVVCILLPRAGQIGLLPLKPAWMLGFSWQKSWQPYILFCQALPSSASVYMLQCKFARIYVTPCHGNQRFAACRLTLHL